MKAAALCTSWQCLITTSFKSGSSPSLSTSDRSYIVCCIGDGSKEQYPVTNSFAEGREWLKEGEGDVRARSREGPGTESAIWKQERREKKKAAAKHPQITLRESKLEHHRLFH